MTAFGVTTKSATQCAWLKGLAVEFQREVHWEKVFGSRITGTTFGVHVVIIWFSIQCVCILGGNMNDDVVIVGQQVEIGLGSTCHTLLIGPFGCGSVAR